MKPLFGAGEIVKTGVKASFFSFYLPLLVSSQTKNMRFFGGNAY